VRRLYRSRKDRMISGICGGIGEYFKVDPVLVRVVAILLVFTGGVGVVAYIAGLFIIPEQPLAENEPEEQPSPEPESSSNEQHPVEAQSSQATPSHSGPVVFGLILVILGAFFMLRNIPLFSGYYWWIRDHLRIVFWPGILIGFGIFLIIRNSRR